MSNLNTSEEGINNRFIASYSALKALRRVGKKGEFCESLGLRPEYFSRYERNELAVPDEAIKNLSKVYQISEDWLLYNRGEMFAKDTEPGGSYRIKGNANVQGTGNQVAGQATDCEQQLALALKEIEGLKSQVELYKEMIALLKK